MTRSPKRGLSEERLVQATSNKKTNKSRIREKYFSILHTLLSAMHDLCLIIYHSTQEGQRGKV